MGELFAGLGLGGGMTPMIVGAAAIVCIVSIAMFVGASQKETAQKKRFKAIAEHRDTMRSAHLLKDDGRDRTRKDEKKLEALIDKLRLHSQLDDDTVKTRLARAGQRTKSDRMRFALYKLAFPPVFALLAVVGYHVVMEPEVIDFLTYGGIALAGAGIGYFYPGMRVDGLAAQRKKKIQLAYPDALDLMTICVEAGMPMEQSMNKVAGELGAYAYDLVEEMKITTSELSYLGDRRLALENFVNRTDLPAVRTLVSSLNQSERYGTPLGQALRVLGSESRFDRMAKAEEKAASLPAKLTVPMMIFFIPVLFIVVLGPAIIQMMDEFAKT